MCETSVISQRIGKIGRRSYDRRLRIASPLYVEKRGELPRLLNDVDRLSELLHNEFQTITADDFYKFSKELKIVISTLKALHKESLSHIQLKVYNERMSQQIADLEELVHDIKIFRVEAPRNKELQKTLSLLDSIDLSRFAD